MKTKVLDFCIIVAAVLLAAAHADARVIQAASCQFADVSNAVLQASPGDVVQLPPGTNWWAETLVLNGVSLIGAGTNLTVIIDEENRSVSGQILKLNAVAGTFSEIANIQFEGGVTNTTETYSGSLEIYGVPSSSWRIDHNVFNGLYAKSLATSGNAFNVIDHNTFYERGISVEDNGFWTNDPEGDYSWVLPPTYGVASSNVLYVENNYFSNMETYVGSVGATDGEGGGRIVFRYNTVVNDCFNNHGTESGGRLRSARSFEIYGNTFFCPPTSTILYPIYAACMIRGGSGVIFSNTINGYNAVAAIRNFRYTCSYLGEWEPFGGANGLSPFDSNDPTLYLTGTSAGPNGAQYLQVSGANWTPNQWVGYALIDTNSGLFSQIASNTVNTAYYLGATPATLGISQCTLLSFNTGDTFQIRRVFAALDQPGRGSGDLFIDIGMSNGILWTINAALGKAAWPRESLECIYSWGNMLDGAPGELNSTYPNIQLNRDYYNETPKPGYTPYTYPHPLTFVSVSSTTGTTGTNTIGTGTNTTGTGTGTNTTGTGTTGTNNSSTNTLLPPPGFHIIP